MNVLDSIINRLQASVDGHQLAERQQERLLVLHPTGLKGRPEVLILLDMDERAQRLPILNPQSAQSTPDYIMRGVHF